MRRVTVYMVTVVAVSVLTVLSVDPQAWNAPHRDFVYDESAFIQQIDPSPAPDPEDMPDHGPSVSAAWRRLDSGSGREVTWEFGCYFSIEDNYGDYWQFDYEAYLYDPSWNLLKSHGAGAHKPAFSSNLSIVLTDPDEGTYHCVVDWWIEYEYVARRQKDPTLTYLIPTGETTTPVNWYDTQGRYSQTLTGGSFVGRKVREIDPGGGNDGCYREDDGFDPLNKVTNTPEQYWQVETYNVWRYDKIGYSHNHILKYRQRGRAPCNTSFPQEMQINVGTNGWKAYRTNILKAGITATTIWVERDGEPNRMTKEYLTDPEGGATAAASPVPSTERGAANTRERRRRQ